MLHEKKSVPVIRQVSIMEWNASLPEASEKILLERGQIGDCSDSSVSIESGLQFVLGFSASSVPKLFVAGSSDFFNQRENLGQRFWFFLSDFCHRAFVESW